MKGKGRTQGMGLNCVVAIGMVALLIAATKTAYDYWNEWVKGAQQTLIQRHTSPRIPDTSVHLKAFGMTGRTTKRSRLAVLR